MSIQQRTRIQFIVQNNKQKSCSCDFLMKITFPSKCSIQVWPQFVDTKVSNIKSSK